VEKDRFPRSRFSEDRLGLVPGDWRGVEPEASEESDPNEEARLCMLRLWVSLLFMRASRVTFG